MCVIGEVTVHLIDRRRDTGIVGKRTQTQLPKNSSHKTSREFSVNKINYRDHPFRDMSPETVDFVEEKKKSAR